MINKLLKYFLVLFFILHISGSMVQAALIDPSNCTIEATKTELFADGSTKSYITVTIKNSINNPVSNVQVELKTNRSDSDLITNPTDFTNNDGQCTGYVIGIYGSTINGTSGITAYVVTEDTYIADTVYVYFKPVKTYPYYDDFEYSTQGGNNTVNPFHDWFHSHQNMTQSDKLWEHGDPVGGDDAADDDSNGPTTGYNSNYCWATNIDGAYSKSGSNIYVQYMWLRSTAIDLRTSSKPLLLFYDWSDIEDPSGGTYWDYAELRIMNANDLNDSYVLETPYNTDHTWSLQSYKVPEALVGKLVQVEFRLHSDPGTQEAGWYIDNFFVREQTDTGNSTVVSNSNSLNIDIGETTLITVNIKDAFNNNLPHVIVTLMSNGTGDTIVTDTATTNDSGQAFFTVYGSTAENVTYTAMADSLTIEQTVNINYYSRLNWVVINEIGWAGLSTGNFEYIELYNTTNDTINLTNWQLGDGTDTITTVSFNNKQISPNSFFLIEYSEITTSVTGNIISSNLALSDAGEYLKLIDNNSITIDTADFSGGWTAGNSNYYSAERVTGTNNWDTGNNFFLLNNNSQSAYGTPKSNNSAGISNTYSTVTSNDTLITAGETATLIFSIRNFDNQPVSGINCVFTGSRSSGIDTVIQTSPTDSNGFCTGYIYSITSGTSTISFISPNNITDTLSIYWKPDTVSLSKSYVTGQTPAGVGADSVLITIYLKDQYNNNVYNQPATFSSNLGDSTAPSGLTNNSGIVTGYLWSNDWGTATVNGIFNGNNFTASTSVFFDTLITIPWIDTFPTTTLDSTYWQSSNLDISIDNGATAEPSAPNALLIGPTDQSQVVTKFIDLSKYGPDNVEAYLYFQHSGTTSGRSLRVEYKTPTGWVIAFEIPYYPAVTTYFKKREITLPAEAFFSGFQLRLTKINNTSSYYVDNITVRPLPSVTLSTVSSTTGDTADMVDSALVTVTVKDAADKVLSDETVTLFTDRANDSIVSSTAVSNSNGEAYFYVKSTKTGTSTFTAKIGTVQLNDTATCYFISGNVSADTSIVLSQTNVSVGNRTQAMVTIILLDKYNNPVSNKTVSISTDRGNDTVIQPTSQSDENGKVYAYVQSEETGVSIVSVIDTTDSISITDTASITFIIPTIVINEIMYNPPLSDPQDEWFEIYNSSSDTVTIDTYYITNTIDTFMLINKTFSPNSYYTYSYSANGGNWNISSDSVYGGIASNFELYNNTMKISIYDSQYVLVDEVEYYNNWSSDSHPDDNQGRSLEKIVPQGASNSSSNWDYSRKNGGTPNLINTMRVINSSLTANDTFYASPTDSIYITINLKDYFNNLVNSETVVLSSSNSSDTIIQSSNLTSNGICYAYVKSSISGYRTISFDTPAGIDTNIRIKALAEASNSVISGDNQVIANMIDSGLISVYLLNSGNTPLPGETVYISSNRSSDSISTNYQVTNSSGTAYFYIKSTSSGTTIISVDTPTVTDTYSINFSSDSVSAETSTISYSNEGFVNISNIQIKVYLYDTYGNPVPNHSVVFETTSLNLNDTITQPVSQTNSSGYTYGYVKSPDTGISYFKVIDSTDSVVLSDSAKISFREASVLINEIMYYPSTNDNGNGEWIELYNLTNDTINIGGWYLKDNTDDSHQIVAGSKISPNGYFLLEYDESATSTAADDIYGDDAPTLTFSDASESILLMNDSGTIVSYIQYSSSWYSECNGNGKSLEKVLTESQDNNNIVWHSSAQNLGTPKKLNSVKLANTAFEILKNNAINNNNDTCNLKVILKDIYNNYTTEEVNLSFSSNRGTSDTLIYNTTTNSQGQVYVNITSYLTGQSTVSVDTPSYISDTEIITFISPTISILYPSNNSDTHTNINLNGNATNCFYGDSVWLYLNSQLIDTTAIQTGDTFYEFNNISLSGSNDSLYVKVLSNYNVYAISDSIIINYTPPPVIEINYPSYISHDTSTQIITVSGTTLNTNINDTVELLRNSSTQSDTLLTALNGSWSGTVSLSTHYDSIVVKVTDQFGRTAYDTILVNYNLAPETVSISLPITGSDTYYKRPWLIWSVPNDANGDSLHFKIEVSYDTVFSTLIDTGNSNADTLQFRWYHSASWDSFPTEGVISGNDTVSFIPDTDLIGDSIYWRVIAYDKFVWSGTSTVSVWNPAPKIQITNFIDTVMLNGQNITNDTGIIPGATIFTTINVQNIGADTANNVLIKFEVPNHTVYSDTFIIDSNDTVQWSVLSAPNQAYNSVDYTDTLPPVISNVKWIRFKSDNLLINSTSKNVLKFIVK